MTKYAELKTVYTAPNGQVAALLQQRLEDEGIQATVSAPFPHPPGIATEPRVLVNSDDYKLAKEIAEQFEQQLLADGGSAEKEERAEESSAEGDLFRIDDDGWSGWPLCENCQTRRQTLCPVCATAGIDFPLADDVEAAPRIGEAAPEADGEFEVREALLMCEHCEEAFKPVFYRHCHACGHDHERGCEPPPVDDQDVSPRATVVMLGLAILAIAAFAYFWFVLR